MCLDRVSGKCFLQAFAIDKDKIISVDGIERREVEPQEEIVSTDQRQTFLTSILSSLRPRIIRMDDHLIETNVSQLQGTLPSAIHRIKCHSLLKGPVPIVLHS